MGGFPCGGKRHAGRERLASRPAVAYDAATMGKKFANMVCVYCGARPSTRTGDHVFARKFFPMKRRDNLPKVPACKPCNNEKSELERYLTAVLPFGGRHPDASANLADNGPRRLARNRALGRRLAAGMSRVWTQEGGVYVRAYALPFEPEMLTTLFELIAKGLAWHHWRLILPPDAGAFAITLTGAGERLLASKMPPAEMRVSDNLGGDAFSYEGVRASDNLTYWMFSVYGGLKLGGDPSAPREEASKVGVVTASRSFIDQLTKMNLSVD